ncbi:endonuclease/exonuclease/phosphatase family protein [Spongiactinospora sp. TRM90649]|uniref:endonuclease/exonuclease/phosphatase family protein n=1 Tax=Spongiactinospora sp. TRM90649 TaxID=3031114 RepID=UPI0023F7B0D3|nr:endonuclease/exonuclease/phosphatase family protein [Spongiactinospora sp. TRM90649]MDF5755724.1 endonuclease/exonuclease/phosphatase family protein [Spongiactinospora sp. TRM90649]
MGLDVTDVPPETTRGRRRRGRWVSALAWLPAAPVLAWTVLRLTGWDAGFRWVQLVAFTPYVALASVAVCAVVFLLGRRLAGTACAAAAICLALAVLPRAFAEGNPPAGGPNLRVMAANLAKGGADANALAKLIRRERPDVMALQEITPAAALALDEHGLRALLPYRTESLIRPGVGGSAVYARFPVRELTPIDLGNFGQSRALLSLPSGPPVEIVSVHPCAPAYDYKYACWADGLRALPRPGATLTVLAGDFNATLDHAPMRDLVASGYRDAADVTGHGLTPTWPMQGWSTLPGVTLDHVLADQRIATLAFRAHPLAGTDHKTVVAELRLP